MVIARDWHAHERGRGGEEGGKEAEGVGGSEGWGPRAAVGWGVLVKGHGILVIR